MSESQLGGVCQSNRKRHCNSEQFMVMKVSIGTFALKRLQDSDRLDKTGFAPVMVINCIVTSSLPLDIIQTRSSSNWPASTKSPVQAHRTLKSNGIEGKASAWGGILTVSCDVVIIMLGIGFGIASSYSRTPFETVGPSP